jgi:hypothetical protein
LHYIHLEYSVNGYSKRGTPGPTANVRGYQTRADAASIMGG